MSLSRKESEKKGEKRRGILLPSPFPAKGVRWGEKRKKKGEVKREEKKRGSPLLSCYFHGRRGGEGGGRKGKGCGEFLFLFDSAFEGGRKKGGIVEGGGRKNIPPPPPPQKGEFNPLLARSTVGGKKREGVSEKKGGKEKDYFLILVIT